MTGEALKGHLDLLLLAALRAGPLHGYAIIERLRARSGGAFDLAEGTIYPALHRLERASLLESSWAADTPRRRRVYRLNGAGEAALVRESASWQAFSKAVEAVIGGCAWNGA